MLVEQENKQAREANKAKNMIRPGVVVSTNPAAGTVRVQFGDADNLVSHDLPVIVPKTHKDKAYFMPDVGEQVLCAFLPSGLENGFVLGSFYSDADTPPVSSQDKWAVAFADGTVLEYDRGASKLTANCVGDVSVTAAGKVEVIAPQIELTGAVTINGPLTVTGGAALGGGASVTGDISATGSIMDTGGNSNHHTHLE